MTRRVDILWAHNSSSFEVIVLQHLHIIDLAEKKSALGCNLPLIPQPFFEGDKNWKRWWLVGGATRHVQYDPWWSPQAHRVEEFFRLDHLPWKFPHLKNENRPQLTFGTRENAFLSWQKKNMSVVWKSPYTRSLLKNVNKPNPSLWATFSVFLHFVKHFFRLPKSPASVKRITALGQPPFKSPSEKTPASCQDKRIKMGPQSLVFTKSWTIFLVGSAKNALILFFCWVWWLVLMVEIGKLLLFFKLANSEWMGCEHTTRIKDPSFVWVGYIAVYRFISLQFQFGKCHGWSKSRSNYLLIQSAKGNWIH